MRKKLWTRCLLGAPLGLALSCAITIGISLTIGDGTYYAVAPALIADCGSELNAVVWQAVCSLLYGAALAGATLVWEKENWSLLRQTVTHLCVCSAAVFPIAWLMRWMGRDVAGALAYFGAFFGAYLLIWLIVYALTKRRVRQMNARVRADKSP